MPDLRLVVPAHRPGQRVAWVASELHETGPDGQVIQIAAGDVATVVLEDWSTDFVVSFEFPDTPC